MTTYFSYFVALFSLLALTCLNSQAQPSNNVYRGTLPDLNAVLPDGSPIKLRELTQGKYTVLSAGCLTCPEFHKAYREVEAAAADYTPKGVQFFFVYKSLRHPEHSGYLQPQNMPERLLQMEAAKQKLETTVPWIVDTMDNEMREALGIGANSVYLISPDGEVVYASSRLKAESLRSALVKHVGAIKQVTSADDLNLPRISRPSRIVNEDNDLQVKRPDGLTILKITPEKPEETYYVKLRVEAEKELLETGTGRLFLGFYPDPIHEAHWNNLTEPMQYTLTLPNGVEATPAKDQAVKGPGDTDTQPRQFWVSVKADKPIDSIQLKLDYFACTDSLCLALTQSYTIHFEPINDGSRTFGMNRGSKRKK
ncbi:MULTISPECIES: peroxiredoxin [unclassified Lentimonas]|uniref:peroxiredoxin family protein n=1 Tax=unclassified Lentimonas TaxID=2630993 RepID=UPI001326D24B|nr:MULTISPECIES: redoxin domain-containing protein [unclassified Lentimonas]CAA6677261.1 Unannotated [Lentimonas sp. CC4]CAA6686114.1 Unannotated [Lentimonas sp. CC6]CAA7074146.1 Unannotated [Lentimonas sp. CC4]CAA7171504.1 Unannotated [Lentimonas sp. CC21]CAA7181982.1 Unannotated [Lentimonas sp. CC8]